MPLYDFQCRNKDCRYKDTDIEILCKYEEIKNQVCKNCSQTLEKIIRPPDGPRVPHISWSQWRAV